jgi:hypothetical protein
MTMHRRTPLSLTLVLTATLAVAATGCTNDPGGDQSGTTQERSRTIPKQVGELQALIVGPGERR